MLRELVNQLITDRYECVIHISSPDSDFVLKRVDGGLLKPLHKQIGYDGAHWRPHGGAFDLEVDNFVELEVCCLEAYG